MKLSYDYCPLCFSQLEMQILNLENNYVIISYFCPQKINYYSEAKNKIDASSHYFIRTFTEGDIVVMIIFPYLLTHNLKINSETSITKIYLNKSRKYIITIPLLDIDYNQPQLVINRIERLITFS